MSTWNDEKTVKVRRYTRTRFDQIEDVIEHWRRPPR